MDTQYEKITAMVEKHRKLILDAEKYIWKHPEIGYKEWKTSAYLEERFRELGYCVHTTRGIPGFTAIFDTGVPGPTVAVMGELDALICETHPDANPDTKAVHACGHLVQTSAMLGVAAAIREPEVSQGLSGCVKFIAVPAEETIDLEYRDKLIADGIIKYVAGKIEFMYRGLFDDVDMAMMIHADTEPDKLFKLIDGCDGCITKHIEYKGTAAHAGGAPYKGVNALYAATLGMDACNALRETFREKDYVRYHPIITKGGSAANAIPDLVKMDTYVRAADLKTMLDVNVKINRALAASAAAIGANVVIEDKPGNLPFHSSREMNQIFAEVVEKLFGRDQIIYAGWDTQSSDIGDLSTVIPLIQPLCMGASGTQHGEDYAISDLDKAVINPAKAMTCMLYELLRDHAAVAKKVMENYKPLYADKKDFFKTIDRIAITKELVKNNPDGTVTLDFHNPNFHIKPQNSGGKRSRKTKKS